MLLIFGSLRGNVYCFVRVLILCVTFYITVFMFAPFINDN